MHNVVGDGEIEALACYGKGTTNLVRRHLKKESLSPPPSPLST